MRNHEVTEPRNLLDTDGNVAEPGWARRPLWAYSRESIKAAWHRIKEWDYYMVVGKDFAIALTLSDIAFLGVQTVSFFDLGKKPWVVTKSAISVMPNGSMGFAPVSDQDGTVKFNDHNLSMDFTKRDTRRHLRCIYRAFHKKKDLHCDIVLEETPGDSIVVATPWPKAKHFYYNQKINCLRASGYVELGDQRFEFDPATDFATLDWGRGAWTHDNVWYWGSGNSLVEGKPFGFNLGYGFADTRAASENIIFYDGIGHKLDDVFFVMSNEKKFTAPWYITSSDRRFEAEFTPILDRSGGFNLGFAGTDQHQVFGRMMGKVVLDDGTELGLNNLLCFIERVRMTY